MTSLSGKGLPTTQDTELFVIDSSPIQGVGLDSRVIRRKDNFYMLPRSPSSPTLHGHIVATQISGSRNARFNRDYTLTHVSELEVEPLQIFGTLRGRVVPLAHAIDFGKARTFNPSDDHTSEFSQLHSLDMLPARGLSEVDFWNLFSKCQSCLHFMTTRTIPYHVCPVPGAELKHTFALNDSDLKKRVYFMRLLDVHDVGHASGVRENIFRAIFYVCRQCNRYMTHRISYDHHEDADLGDYTCINSSLPLATADGADSKYTSITGRDRLRAAQEFPKLEPLYL